MKRSGPPQRRKTLSRAPTGRKPPGVLRASPTLRKVAKRLRRAPEPGEAAWKRRRSGYCKGCSRYGRIVLHHLVDENHVRDWATEEQLAEGIAWDRRNALELGAPLPWGGSCHCHGAHHHPGSRDTRLPFSKIPEAALQFAEELMGDAAMDYWRRKYREVP